MTPGGRTALRVVPVLTIAIAMAPGVTPNCKATRSIGCDATSPRMDDQMGAVSRRESLLTDDLTNPANAYFGATRPPSLLDASK